MGRIGKKAVVGAVSIALGLAMTGCGAMETNQPAQTRRTDAEAALENVSVKETEIGSQDADPAADGQEAKAQKIGAAAGGQEAKAQKIGSAADGQDMETGEREAAAQNADPAADGWETADRAVQNMRIGWNLGNALDSTGSWILQSTPGSVESFETAWGNPVTPKALLPKLKSMGFQAVRIPVTWNYHFDENGRIDAEWMARVREIVDWAMEADLYCIINIHHDTGADGWLRASEVNYEKNSELYARLWEQIAAEFIEYPDLLLFEGFNEMLDEKAEWNSPNAESVEAVNRYNQLFVDTVRGTGGKNAERNLVCCTYAAAMTDAALNGFQMPEDSTQGHLIAEVHFYTPYEFITEEGVTWTAPVKEYTDAVKRQMDEAFMRLAGKFTDRNVPLIIGEFASDDKDNTEDRIEWYTHVVEKAKEIGAVCFIWDNGNGFCMGHIDRVGNEDSFPQIIEACVKTSG